VVCSNSSPYYTCRN